MRADAEHQHLSHACLLLFKPFAMQHLLWVFIALHVLTTLDGVLALSSIAGSSTMTVGWSFLSKGMQHSVVCSS